MMEDHKIVALYWERSERAVAETARKYGNYCHKIAYQVLANREDAEESVNDAFLDAWNSMPPHRPRMLSTFLGKLTRRVAIDKWRGRTAQKRGGGEITLALEELGECIPSARSVEREIDAAELAKLVNAFVMQLPRTERRVFLCRYWYLDSVAEIAKQFGFSESKVKTMLYRQRKRLLALLQEEEYLT